MAFGTRHWLARVIAAAALGGAALGATAGCGGKEKAKEEDTAPDEPKAPTAAELVGEARAAVAAGDLDAADAKFAAAYQASGDLAVLEEHVAALYTHRRVDRAVELARGYYDANPVDPRGMHLYAQALIAAGDYATALQVTDELLGLDENDAAAHEKKGRALILAGQLEPGVEELRKAVAIAPKEPQFLVELGSGLHRAGKVDEAALQLRTAIQLDPDNGRALMLLGLALADQAELEEAEVFLVKATKASNDARPWFELGIVQNKRGDDLGAEASLQQAVEREPDNSLYQYAYGEMLRINKRYDQAIEAYRKATELDPPHPKASAKLGLTLAHAQRLGEAELHLTTAVRNDPKNQYNYFNLAYVYREQNKTRLAIEAYEKFLELADPDDGDRRAAEACLKNLKRKRKCN